MFDEKLLMLRDKLAKAVLEGGDTGPIRAQIKLTEQRAAEAAAKEAEEDAKRQSEQAAAIGRRAEEISAAVMSRVAQAAARFTI